MSELFKLIESEESPFRISKQGSESLTKAIETMDSLEKYEKLIKKTLAIRILQKSKGFYTNIKFKSLEKLLSFYGSWDDIENLLYECNRQNLVMTIVDHANQNIGFDQIVQVHENLVNFGNKLRVAFQKVQ